MIVWPCSVLPDATSPPSGAYCATLRLVCPQRPVLTFYLLLHQYSSSPLLCGTKACYRMLLAGQRTNRRHRAEMRSKNIICNPIHGDSGSGMSAHFHNKMRVQIRLREGSEAMTGSILILALLNLSVKQQPATKLAASVPKGSSLSQNQSGINAERTTTFQE